MYILIYMDNLIALKEARDALAAQVQTLRSELEIIRKSRQAASNEMNNHQKTVQDTLAGVNSGMNNAAKNQTKAALLASRNAKANKKAEMEAIGPALQSKRAELNAKEQEFSAAEIAYKAALEDLA